MSDSCTILGIESSCDETALALVRDGTEVLASFVASQIDLHRPFGGVIPEVACRAHMDVLLPGLKQILDESSLTPDGIDAIAVTHKPGLIGALLVGLTAAKGLALAWEKPLIGVNHIEAHIAAARFGTPALQPPFVALVVSGGHTNLYHVPDLGSYTCVGATRDDAAGEAFDKAAKLLDLGFPGGPAIEKAARKGNPKAYPWRQTCLPKTSKTEFSFSGIKTAVLYAARGQKAGRKGPLLLSPDQVADGAASFQDAVVHALVKRTIHVATSYDVKWIALGGGVAANGELRERMETAARKVGIALALPERSLCTDNAIMIALRGTDLYREGCTHELDLAAAPRGA